MMLNARSARVNNNCYADSLKAQLSKEIEIRKNKDKWLSSAQSFMDETDEEIIQLRINTFDHIKTSDEYRSFVNNILFPDYDEDELLAGEIFKLINLMIKKNE